MGTSKNPDFSSGQPKGYPTLQLRCIPTATRRRNRRRTTSSINAWRGRASKTSNRWSEITRACGNVSGKLPSNV